MKLKHAKAGAMALALAGLMIAGCGRGPMAQAPLRAATGPRSLSTDDLLARTFALADADGDGRLSRAESGLERDMAAALDEDRDGAISAAEFGQRRPAWLIRARMPAFAPLMRATFAQVDHDRDGAVGPGEAAMALGALDGKGQPLLDADERARFGRHDRDADRALDAGEFTGFYLELGAGGDLQAEGFLGRLGGALIGGYLRLTGQLAAHRAMHPPREPLKTTPKAHGFDYEDVAFVAEDGIKLSAWYIPATKPTTQTLVLVHGFQTNRALWFNQGQVQMLAGRYNLVMPDLRNHGQSGGSLTTYAYYEHLDVRAAVKYAKARGATSIGLAGQSLGAASVIRAAAFEPDVKAVFEDAGYANMIFAWQGGISSVGVPLPAMIAASALAIANAQLGIDLRDAEPIAMIDRMAPIPLMLVHGQDDPFIFVDHVRSLHTAYKGPKELWICPRALHGDSATTDAAGYRERFVRHFATHM